ncbi:MAG TPA: hypothetical protein VGH90_13805 [Chthoniobacteraceae bacterium]|jgi:hypothetical protein
MSALEVIEQIKALPPAERRKVAIFVRELDTPTATSAQGEARPNIDALAAEIFDEYDELFRKLAQ